MKDETKKTNETEQLPVAVGHSTMSRSTTPARQLPAVRWEAKQVRGLVLTDAIGLTAHLKDV